MYLLVINLRNLTVLFLVKTGRWAGVVTAFITMSDVKDEIDWEFPGNDTTHGQSNLFWQGNIRKWMTCYQILLAVSFTLVAAKTQGGKHDVSSDSYSNYHDYTVRTR